MLIKFQIKLLNNIDIKSDLLLLLYYYYFIDKLSHLKIINIEIIIKNI